MPLITFLLAVGISLSAHVCDAEAITENLATKSHDVDISPNLTNHLEVSSIIFGLSKLASEEQLSRQCFQEFKSIERGIIAREPWAMKVLDASGAKDSGFIWGQNYWLGSPEGCATVQSPLQITLSSRYDRNMKDGLIAQTAPFQMDYRVAHVKHDSPWQVEIKFMKERTIHIGLCLPSSCSSAEVQNLTQTFLNENVLMKMYDLQAEVLYVKDLNLKDSFFDKISFKIITGVVLFTLAMMIAARFLPGDGKDIDKDGALTTFIKCFDIVSNARALFAFEENTPNSIPVINGLRSVSCFWIMMFHVPCFAHFTVSNKAILTSYAEQVLFQYVSNTPFLVDVFFTVSGFLQAYNFMNNEQQLEKIRRNTLLENVRTFAGILFHRYLRLAPPYLILVPLMELFTSYAQDVSFFEIQDRYDESCSNHWWRYPIFVQNFFDISEMCVNWTWSLACEMHFFLLTLALLFVYARHPRAFKPILVVGILAAVARIFHVGLKCKFQVSFDVIYNTLTDTYFDTSVRILPHLVGSLSACWLMQNKHFTMGAIAEKCAWNLAIVAFLACIHSTIKRDVQYLLTSACNAVGRVVFSSAICWMIIGSATGRSCWWSRILEHRLFQHINRLSYSIYLINPVLIVFVFSLSKVSTHVDPLMLCVVCSGFAVIVYFASIVFSLAFEIPYCNWSSALKKSSKKLKVT